MKLNEKYDINPEFEELFSFKSKDEENEHEAKMIMFRFLSELEKFNGKPIKKKELAKALETSPSYVTQLFRGDKIINLPTLAKIQNAFDITFEIVAKSNTLSYDLEVISSAKCIPFVSKCCMEKQLYNEITKPDYTNQVFPVSSDNLKIAR